MKKFFSVAILCMAGSIVSAQFIYKIKADSVLITNDSCTAELILENSTKNVCGFLFNKGKGRTEFRSALIKLNDSTYVVGCDTLHLHSGIGGVTANNGLTANISPNVQLGGNLLHSTEINTDTFNLKISGVNTNDSIAILNLINNTPINTIGNATSLRIVSPNADGINISAGNGIIVNTGGSALVAHTGGTAIATYGVGSTPGIAVQVESGPGVSSIFTSGIGLSASGTTGTGIQSIVTTGTGIRSTVTTGKAAIFTINPTTTNTIATIMDIYRKSSGTAANEIGGSIQYHTQTTSSFQDRISNTLISKWSNATDASRTSQFEVWGVNNGAAIGRKLALAGNGQLILDGYGSGTKTGTPSYTLAVDSTGNVIETTSGGTITADNGLTANTATNVRLGGNLNQSTVINSGEFTTSFSGSNLGPVLNAENDDEGVALQGVSTNRFGYGIVAVNSSTDGNALAAYSQAGSAISAISGTGMGVSIGTTEGLPLHILANPSTPNNGVFTTMKINRATGSTGANGIGSAIDFTLETNLNTLELSNRIISKFTDATSSTRTSQFIIAGVNSAVTADLFTLSGSGALKLNKYGTGTFTGTPTYNLAVDASGNVIETSSGGSGISTLNTLTGSTQSFATGTSGTDFNISSSGTTHTFNFPNASSSNRGLITTGAQTIAGAKTFSALATGGTAPTTTGTTKMVISDVNGLLSFTSIPAGYSTVQEGGSGLAQQANLNFGYGVTATNNSGSSRTDVDVDLANSESFLTSDVTLTANTYSDAVSFSLVAGTWMISGNATVESPNNTAQRVTYKLWDGTTVYQAGEAACNAMGANTKGYVSVPVSGLIVLSGTTTIKISVASTAASLIKATPGDNSTGTTNKATSFRAVRIK